jgi:hypothetical protein
VVAYDLGGEVTRLDAYPDGRFALVTSENAQELAVILRVLRAR